jgi:hypothetical protein
VPVLHLAEDLPGPDALGYARSVEAGWVAYPAPDGVRLLPVEAGVEHRTLPVGKVAGEVLR